MTPKKFFVLALSIISLGSIGNAQESSTAHSTNQQGTLMQANEILKTLIGKWEGTCKTWFEPNKLADESKVSGEFCEVLNGRFVRHNYKGEMQSKPRNGEELITFNGKADSFQISWIDDFHMNYAIMFSQGESTRNGFVVVGQYDVGKDQPAWKWRTEYELGDDDTLTITAYNISPDGSFEAKAVETKYTRVK